MSDQDNSGPVAPAEAITDYASMKAKQVTVHQWQVLNLAGDRVTHYLVNTLEGTCNCPADKFQGQQNDEKKTTCKHLAYVLSGAGQSMELDTQLALDASNTMRDVREAAEKTLDAAEAMGSGPLATDEQESSEDANSGSNDSGGSSDGQVTTDGVGADDNQDQLMTQLGDWFDKASDFHDFDPDIIDLEWAEADGQEGVAVNREPFAAGYWDDGDWVDKDAYESERDKAGEVLSNRDEFSWYGEPDYVYFVPEDDVMEVLD